MSSPELIRKRKELHRHPELSGREEETAARIEKWLNELKPDELITHLGGTGLIARFKASGQTNKTILFRAELDAIAVNEASDIEYSSEANDVMHGCGHDGHMVILLGLAQWVAENRPQNTDTLILFQPAEETGEGAGRVLTDPRFQKFEIDHAFALHNLPGFKENSVILREGVFASASTGLEVSLQGKSSHAAYPEQGVNPAGEVLDILSGTQSVFNNFSRKNRLNKAVCSFIRLGNQAFGISPGNASIGFTLRSPEDDQLREVLGELKKIFNEAARSFKGTVSISLREPFSATVNDPEGVRIVREASKDAGLIVHDMENPFPWSEDFGAFGEHCPVTLFGLGSGQNHPPLHSESYDFNDRLINTAVELFSQIIKLYDHNSKNA
jgi:amidohydrolase